MRDVMKDVISKGLRHLLEMKARIEPRRVERVDE